MPDILLILAHPNTDSFNGALADAYQEGARAAGASLKRLDLGTLHFDPVLRDRDGGGRVNPDRTMPFMERLPREMEPDLKRAMALMEDARHLVFVMPVWWANMPALLKGFFDRTFLPGWAYQHVEGQALPEKRLEGRSARVVSTMDSPWFWYKLKHGRAMHRALKQGTFDYTGISPVKETTLYSVREMSPEKREKWLQKLNAQGHQDGERLYKSTDPAPRALSV